MTLTAATRLPHDLRLSREESAGHGQLLLPHPRIRSSGRDPRRESDAHLARLRFDRFELDEVEARLTCAGEPVALAPKPFAVLCALARTHGRLVTKNALRDLVWGHRFVTDAVLKSAVSEVRSALEDDPKQPRYIETVWRHGYRFIAPAVSSPTQSISALERKCADGSDHPALAALTALCRGDAALAELIRAVAAALERDGPAT